MFRHTNSLFIRPRHSSPSIAEKCVRFLLFFALSASALAHEIENQAEELQSHVDAARRLRKSDSRLVPIAIPISNPTVGTGLAGALLYMHATDESHTNKPTSITGIFGMYTSTESWALGAFHDGYYLDDRIRVRAPITHGEFRLKYYGVGDNSPLSDDPIDYSAVGNLFIPRATFALPADHWYLGGQYRLIDLATKLDGAPDPSDIPGLEERKQTAGLGLVSLYDSRDSNLWPMKGSWLDLSLTLNGEYAGGDYNYLRTIIKWAQYFPLGDSLILVYRLDTQYIEGEAPFWDLARIRLRGYSSGQYLDNVALTAQAELRWKLRPRWTVSLFGGGGRIADTLRDIGSSDTNLAGGTGFRYMLVEDKKLSVGLDAAYSDSAKIEIYFQVGDWLAN